MSLLEARARVARAAAERARQERGSTAWRTASLAASFLETCARRPHATVLIDGEDAIDFSLLRDRVLRLASGLVDLGVRPGDAVAHQLPNWWEAAAACLASWAAGAISVPIVPILREREVAYILDETAPRVFLVPGLYRGFDYAAQAERAPLARAERPSVVVVRGETEERPARAGPSGGSTTGAPVLARRRSFASLLESPPAAGLVPPPDPLAAVVYTSGSTAAPKGALHSHQTLDAEVQSLVAAHGLGPADRTLMPSPLTHVSGLIHGILCPALLGTSAVLMERWDAGAALAAIERERVTYLVGAPTFLQDLLAHPDVEARDLASLRLFSCGGASVPPELLHRARRRIPAMVAKRSYGSSEFPTIATTTAGDAAARGLDTEGRPLPGVEIRVVGDDDRPLDHDVEGEIRARGPECFFGYADARLDPESFDADGYYRTGDLGVIDAGGYLRVTGRVKDIVVRKGEKISAREVEDLLARLPGTVEVAVVPLSDPATGERACACLRLAPGAPAVGLDAVTAFLRGLGLTPQKLPEQVEIVAEFPRTPSGKIHKRLLRERIEARGGSRPPSPTTRPPAARTEKE